MISVQQILSKVQNEVNDLSMDRIHLGEYRDFLNDIAMEIAEQTHIWIGRYEAIPTPRESIWSTSLIYEIGQIVSNDDSYYIAIVRNQGQEPPNATYWTLVTEWGSGISYSIDDYVYSGNPRVYYKAITANTDISPPNPDYWYNVADLSEAQHKVNIPYVDTNGNLLAPFKFIRVVRGSAKNGYAETMEYSLQSIGRSSSHNRTFLPNDITLGRNAFSTQFLNDLTSGSEVVDNSITLNFVQPFETDERVYIDFIQGRPFTLTRWDMTPDIQVPDFMRNAFTWGMLNLSFTRLYNKGDEKMLPRMQNAEKRYYGSGRFSPNGKQGGYLREAVGYAKGFRALGAVKMRTPNKYLPRRENFTSGKML